MFSTKEMPSPSSIFSAYASMTASIMLFRSMANDLIPYPIRNYLFSTMRYFFKPRSPILTLVIEESNGMARNQVYDASEIYLCTRINPNTERLKISKTQKEKNLTIRLEKGEKIVDFYEGLELKWRFVCAEAEKSNNPNDHFPPRAEKRSFELSFHKKHKDIVLNSYVPYVLERAKAIKDEQRVLKMFTLNMQNYGGIKWESINLEHPATFETLAMDPDVKNDVMDDLNRFVKRKEFYKRVGRAWKRGYLLYGPPGTGKSSLVAAMANYLKFDVYDLQLGNIMRDSDLRKLLLATGNRSILVIEDIDCSVDLPDRRYGDGRKQPDQHVQSIFLFHEDGPYDRELEGRFTPQDCLRDYARSGLHHTLTLSGLLNFIDGLWSSCGDERIIIFTTNHKDRLDPALLRPGRMDMHIHMSYCKPQGFKLLASNYLGIRDHHHLFGEIEGLLKNTEVTPAQVAEELMKSEDADIALGGLVKLLKRKKLEGNEPMDKDANKFGVREAKRQKVENKRRSPRIARRKCSRRRNL
ncbi:AAA-ATPase At5g17760-like isoform X1 [Herrania umbratica]|uniref:AAA-ATPase At5g17760-like isoform X1 n=1 Tax=Herrania umbratica TaxID=108875 RepID=A0A6J0ZJD8_9ROSI|nr:AAA-ATPase At5g17760-like isoform X1 [Herrania umbratica]